MTSLDLHRKLHDRPFRPFRIRRVNNTTYDILEPWMVTVGESSAVIVTRSRTDDEGFNTALDWRTVSIAHMLEFADMETPSAERQRKPA